MRLPRRWHGDAEPDEIRWNLGRGGALARGMRQASARDRLVPGDSWQPGPAPAPRQARRQERVLQQRDPGRDLGRAQTLGRGLEQALARDRAEDNQRHVRDTLSARDPQYARTVERAVRELSPRAGRTPR